MVLVISDILCELSDISVMRTTTWSTTSCPRRAACPAEWTSVLACRAESAECETTVWRSSPIPAIASWSPDLLVGFLNPTAHLGDHASQPGVHRTKYRQAENYENKV
jgi:hypothetical protein